MEWTVCEGALPIGHPEPGVGGMQGDSVASSPCHSLLPGVGRGGEVDIGALLSKAGSGVQSRLQEWSVEPAVGIQEKPRSLQWALSASCRTIQKPLCGSGGGEREYRRTSPPQGDKQRQVSCHRPGDFNILLALPRPLPVAPEAPPNQASSWWGRGCQAPS